MNEYPLTLERDLTTRRPHGGRIDAVDFIERSDGKWYINVSISWRRGTPYTAAKHGRSEIKLFTMSKTSIDHIIQKYDYEGKITLYPKTTRAKVIWQK